MDIQVRIDPDDLKRLGAQNGTMVREAMDKVFADLDAMIRETFPDAGSTMDIYQLQGAAKVVARLRETLKAASPQQFSPHQP